MTPPIIALVGKPDGGKTTLLEQLIPELSRRGHRIGTIKHHVHDFAFDTPGKDTWRHKQAGAHIVVLSSPTGIGMIRDTDRDLAPVELVARYFTDVELVIAEGYKKTALPKIEVFRRAVHETPLQERDESWIALITDPPLATDLPCFAPHDMKAIADFLEERFLRRPAAGRTRLVADGAPVALNRFVESFIRLSVGGMVSSLKGCESARRITLTIDLEPTAE